MNETKLQRDQSRVGTMETGIFVRAQDVNGKWISCDIGELTRGSLLDWLRSRGGDNQFAENCIGQLLGYGPLHEPEARR